MAKVAVIGGGLSGLAFAYYLKRHRADYEIRIFEREDIPGGKALTVEENGFLVEFGVNGVLDNKPSTVGLASELGVPILSSNENSKKRFAVRDGSLVELPDAPKKFLTSTLLSPYGKLRVMMEPFIPEGSGKDDESLASFARRRLGQEALDYLIDPMATGIFAGDPNRLSLKGCFPRIYELEQGYGSLVKAMIALAKKARKKGTGKKVTAGPGGTLVSFRGGMKDLVFALKKALSRELICGKAVTEIVKRGPYDFNLTFHDGTEEECTHVILACPARDAAVILKAAIPELATRCSSIDYPPIAVVAFGVRPDDVTQDLGGFGFLIPGCEGRSILGTLWDSSIFENRAPEGWALLRTLMGGARRRDIKFLPDSRVTDMAYKELKELMGLKRPPDFVKVHRWPHAIPQYNVGHLRLIEEIQRILKAQPGIFIRTNWVGGVSLNDCIQNSHDLARSF